jgi:hypothetical protein
MPNHVTNHLTIVGNEQEVAKCLAEIKGTKEDQFIDFNTFAPIPQELVGTQSPVKILTQKDYDEQEKRIANNELSEIEKQWGVSRGITKDMSNKFKDEFGYDNWYDWQIANWGTKWNAYDQFFNDNMIEFSTAWSTPYHAITALSVKYPTLRFEMEFADEDFGHNVGKYTFENGECIWENTPEGGSLEALKMAMEIRGDHEYYLVDYLCENVEDVLDKFTDSLVVLAHEQQELFDDYPVVVLNRLKELALADEQYERIVEIDKLLKAKETAE